MQIIKISLFTTSLLTSKLFNFNLGFINYNHHKKARSIEYIFFTLFFKDIVIIKLLVKKKKIHQESR